jgi:hypothetical protein
VNIKEILQKSIKLSEMPSDACPFSWTEVRLTRGCLGNLLAFIPIIGAAFKEVTIHTPVPCIRDKCKLWHASKNDCVFNDIAID